MIGIGSSITSEEWLVDAADLRSEPRVVWPRTEGVEYDSSHAVIDGEDVLFILHNDGALDFELVRVAASDPSGARQTVIPHRPGERLLGVSTFRDWGVVGYRRGGLPRIGMLDYADGSVSEIEFDEPLYAVGAGGNPEWAPPVLRLGYGSFVTPGTVYDYEVATGDLLLRKRQPVLGGYEPERLRAGAGVGDRARRRADPDLAGVEALVRRGRRRAARRCTSTATARTSTRSSPGFSVPAAVGARPRRDLRRRPRARRRRDGPPVVRRRQDAAASATRSRTSSTAPGT